MAGIFKDAWLSTVLSGLHLPSACRLQTQQAVVTSGYACCVDCARFLGSWTGKSLRKASTGLDGLCCLSRF